MPGYDDDYYYDHFPPTSSEEEAEDAERWSPIEPDELPPQWNQPDESPEPDESPPKLNQAEPESDQAEPECNCIECLQARGEEITPEMLEEARFGAGINKERGYEVLAGFGQQDGTEAEQVTELCGCWYPSMSGVPDNVKMDIHQWVSMMTVPVQGQAIPEDEQEDLATDQLMSDMESILGKFRKNSR